MNSSTTTIVLLSAALALAIMVLQAKPSNATDSTGILDKLREKFANARSARLQKNAVNDTASPSIAGETRDSHRLRFMERIARRPHGNSTQTFNDTTNTEKFRNVNTVSMIIRVEKFRTICTDQQTLKSNGECAEKFPDDR